MECLERVYNMHQIHITCLYNVYGPYMGYFLTARAVQIATNQLRTYIQYSQATKFPLTVKYPLLFIVKVQ